MRELSNRIWNERVGNTDSRLSDTGFLARHRTGARVYTVEPGLFSQAVSEWTYTFENPGVRSDTVPWSGLGNRPVIPLQIVDVDFGGMASNPLQRLMTPLDPLIQYLAIGYSGITPRRESRQAWNLNPVELTSQAAWRQFTGASAAGYIDLESRASELGLEEYTLEVEHIEMMRADIPSASSGLVSAICADIRADPRFRLTAQDTSVPILVIPVVTGLDPTPIMNAIRQVPSSDIVFLVTNDLVGFEPDVQPVQSNRLDPYQEPVPQQTRVPEPVPMPIDGGRGLEFD